MRTLLLTSAGVFCLLNSAGPLAAQIDLPDGQVLFAKENGPPMFFRRATDFKCSVRDLSGGAGTPLNGVITQESLGNSVSNNENPRSVNIRLSDTPWFSGLSEANVIDANARTFDGFFAYFFDVEDFDGAAMRVELAVPKNAYSKYASVSIRDGAGERVAEGACATQLLPFDKEEFGK